MAAPTKKRVTDEEKLKQFAQNLAHIARHLSDAGLADSLHNLRRKSDQNKKFATKLEKEFQPVYTAVSLLPSSSTLSNQTLGDTVLKMDTVEKIAQFCSNAFAFDRDVPPADLLTKDLTFPPLLKTGHWQQYLGVYRCFYFHPDYSDEKTDADNDKQLPQLHGGLLKLQDLGGTLQAFFATGIHRDTYFHDLQNIFEPSSSYETLLHKCKAYSDSRPDSEIRLVTYHGRVDTSLKDHFLMRLQRHDHTNTALILLRRRDNTAQTNYTGGIALLHLCRGDNVISFPMAVVRPQLTLTGDQAFLTQYLENTQIGPTGTKIIKDLENGMNHKMLERVRDRTR